VVTTPPGIGKRCTKAGYARDLKDGALAPWPICLHFRCRQLLTATRNSDQPALLRPSQGILPLMPHRASSVSSVSPSRKPVQRRSPAANDRMTTALKFPVEQQNHPRRPSPPGR